MAFPFPTTTSTPCLWLFERSSPCFGARLYKISRETRIHGCSPAARSIARLPFTGAAKSHPGGMKSLPPFARYGSVAIWPRATG